MPPLTTAATSLEFLATDGTTWVPVMVARPPQQNADDPAYRTVTELLAAAEADAPVAETVRPTIYETFLGGIGVSYNVAPGVYTRSDGYAMAAGRMTQVQVPNGAGSTVSPIVAFAEYGGDLFCLQQGAGGLYGGRVLRLAGGTGTTWTTVSMTTYGGATYITAGEYMRDLFLFDDGTGATMLYASSSDANGKNGRLHRTSDGVNWTSTAAGTFNLMPDGVNRYGRNRTAPVHWTSGGVSAHRLESISGPNTVAYTTGAGVDPFLAASWTEGVSIKTGYTLLELAYANSHVWHSAKDGLFDLNEQGESPNLISRAAMPLHPVNGIACLYYDGWVYQTVGHGGLHRIRVETIGEKQERQSICRPGWNTPAESEWLAGYTTALAAADGLLNAQYNPTTKRSAVFWGVDRNVVGVDTPNPLVWYGPEFTINANYQITRLWPTGLAGDSRLWLAAQSVVGGQPITLWGSLPDAGAPIDDLISGGQMRFGPRTDTGIFGAVASLEFLPDGMQDRSSLKILNDVTYTTRGLSQQRADDGTITDDGLGTKLVVYTRAVDALAPSSTAWGTGTDVTVGPTQAIVPERKQGYRLQHRIDFVNPSGNATPAKVGVLDACRPTQWPVAPDATVRVLAIEYGDGVETLNRAPWAALDVTPDWVTEELLKLTRFGRTTVRDPWDNRRVVKLLQNFDREVEVRDDGRGESHKRVSGRIRFVDLGEAS